MKSRLSELRKFGDSDFNGKKFDAWVEKNPKEWKKLKSQFDTGRQGFMCQLFNGIDETNEKIIRDFLFEYNSRYLKYGAGVFPTSFNVMEPFFNFNHRTSILELVEEEESYGVSLEEFLDYITSEDFDFSKLDLHQDIPEGIIFHSKFSSAVFEYPFQCSNGMEFYIGHTSLVRRGDDVTVLLHAGRKFTEEEKLRVETEYLDVNSLIIPRKKKLGFTVDESRKNKVVNYLDRDDLWLHLIAVRFDVQMKTIDIRYFAKDCEGMYEALSDDFSAVNIVKEGKISEEDKERYIGYLKSLEEFNSLFEFAKYCMCLPKFMELNEDKIVSIDYPTNLSELIKGPVSRRKFRNISLSKKIFAKPIYYVESPLTSVKKMISIRDESFHIEKSGYWKRLRQDEKGLDKKGKEIIGKTWVERSDTFYIEKEGVVTIKPTKIHDGPNSGIIYIMREPSHHKNIFKVGLTRRSSSIRSKELSNTSSPDSFQVICDFNVKDCVKAEKIIHDKLSDFRISKRREFFNCKLNHIVETCKNVINEINK